MMPAAFTSKIDEKADEQLNGAGVDELTERLLAENGWEKGPADANELGDTIRPRIHVMRRFYTDGGRLQFRIPATVTPEEGDAMLERARVAMAEIEAKTRNVEQLLTDLNAIPQLTDAPQKPK